jgi:hypothetical protein
MQKPSRFEPSGRVESQMLKRAFFIYAMVGGMLFPGVSVAIEKSDEAALTSAFLFQFTKFVEWPVSGDASKDFSICVFEQPQVAKSLESVVESKSTRGKKIVVNELAGADSFERCSILYIGVTEHEKLKPILSRLANLRNHSILTISHAQGFAHDGVMVNFFLDGDHLRFEVNVDAAKSANLTFSSQLLKLARIVE